MEDGLRTIKLNHHPRQPPRVFLLPAAFNASDPFSAISLGIFIRIETGSDRAAIREINEAAFGNELEANLVDQLRAQGHAKLSLMAEVDGVLIGHILFSAMNIKTESETVTALALAPLSVRPEWQRQGVGTQLVKEGLRQCRRDGHRIVLVVGCPAYYPCFGFSRSLAEPISSLYSGEAFMALELEPDALSGVCGTAHYPKPFAEL